ncbi:MAG: ABC transporter permease [Verrucomicrobia bacterium]|nr:MAG: ABC transporter permease [Verrucomicrobiota bacterium]
MPWYFYLAFKQLFPSGKRFSFFAIMAIIGVTLGVMVLVVVTTVMNGFAEQMKSTAHNAAGDVRITANAIIYDTEEFVDKIKKFDFVSGVAPHAFGMVMLKNQDYPGFPLVKGIDLELESEVLPIKDYITSGELKDLDEDSIILGTGFAKSVGARVGSVVEVYTPLMLEHMKKDEILLPKELKVVGIYETGWNVVDSKVALVSLKLMQELYGMEGGIHGVSIKLKPGVDINYAVAELKKAFANSPYSVTGWMEMEGNQEFLFVLKLEKTMMFFIMIFIVLVASFSIASSLMTSVIRKIREIGLIGAMGGTSGQIALSFCFQGFFIGIVGTVLGCILGIIAIYFRNGIVHLILGVAQREAVLANFYQFTEVPAHFLMSDFLIISLSAILIATMAGLLPAIKAARLKPSEALRND